MKYLVISSSLNQSSRSHELAQKAYTLLRECGNGEVGWLDLRQVPLPQCDGNEAYNDPKVGEVTKLIASADCILLATPIYNYDCGSAAKNLIELTGKAWNEKIVGFLCAAGGKNSYMSIMGLVNSLMLDFRCLIIPRFVYADSSAFTSSGLDTGVTSRIAELVETAKRFAVVRQPQQPVIAGETRCAVAIS